MPHPATPTSALSAERQHAAGCLPEGPLYNGDKFPTCSYNRLDALGPADCPKDSIVGHGGGQATADTNFTYPKITIVSTGARPAGIRLHHPRTTPPACRRRWWEDDRLSGRWSYKLHVVIPKVLQVVAGVPIVLHSLHLFAGRGDWLATTYCPPNHKWAYHAVTHFSSGDTLVTDGAVGCHS